jgi:hypothetical protein
MNSRTRNLKQLFGGFDVIVKPEKVCQFNDRAFVFTVAALAAGFTTF